MTTSKAHTAVISCMVRNCASIRKTPAIPARGPCKLEDCVGMSIAVDMLYNSLVSIPRLQGESHIQFELMRRIKLSTLACGYHLPKGLPKGGCFLWDW
jgi:hypothetical protein